MSTNPEHKKPANAHFKKEACKSEESQASKDYRADQQAARQQLTKLRDDRLAREAAQADSENKSKKP